MNAILELPFISALQKNLSTNNGLLQVILGPRQVGKSTLLEALASGHAKGETIKEGVRVGYYRQDFSTRIFYYPDLEGRF